MGVRDFDANRTYRHVDSMELDIHIVKPSLMLADGSVVIEFMFVSKRTGNLFSYTKFPKIERAVIKSEHRQYWSKLR